jgi:hypothetical protein
MTSATSARDGCLFDVGRPAGPCALTSQSWPYREHIFVAMTDRGQRERDVEVLNRAIEASEIRVRDSTIAKCVRVGPVFGNGAIEIRDRAIGVPQLEKDDAPIVERMSVVRVEPNGFVVVAHGEAVLVTRPERVAAIVESVGRARIHTDRLVVVVYGAVDISKAPVAMPRLT